MAQITGEHVDWLHAHGDLYVAVELNNTDPDAIAANSGKAPPRLYRNITGQSFRNAVVVDNGSVVQFKVRSRGPHGFGYRVYAGLKNIRGRTRDLIADRLYCLSATEQSQNTDVDRAYQDADATPQPLIQIKNFPSIDAIAPTDRDLQLGMISCTVVSWGVYGYIDENDEDFGIPLNIGEAPYTNLPGSPPPNKWNQPVNVTASPQVTAFGGGPTRFRPSKGKASQEFSSARLIREDNPRFAPNYVGFTFLVADRGG
ncbi:hypothetical protein EH240_28600 [Mesorhizobium tamadayense]|uniref:Uncharacterized protein n=1 Tax=Mesorhizobium tamadayense TaxID=425306 RepID=A0A3P3F5K2_9HYPH|nr:hypothetical protein [Mesorhizobium tamadayense]RRH93909.1 hypothetical protein EH240_28600 [Mesorhizobium tamadayense]